MRMAPLARPDAGTLLARALIADAARHDLAATVRDWRSHPWASATFTGMRHVATLTLADDPTRWVASLPEAEFAIRGHLVADLVARLVEDGGVALEALTLDTA